MKSVAVAVAALALQVVAHESLDKADYFPECSLDCLTEAVEKGVECDESDSICLCEHENYEAIYEYSMDCIIDACGEDEAIESVLPAAEPYCSAATSLYSATGTAPLPTSTHTHSHDEEEEHEEEEEEEHTHSHDEEEEEHEAPLDKADFFPECALDCLTEAVEKGVECDETDSICLCEHENYEAIYEYSMDCIIDACGEEKAIDEVLPAAEPYCEAATSLYSATATAPLPSSTHSHDEEEEGEEHTHSHDEEEEHEEETDAPKTTKAPADASATEADAATGTDSTATAVSTGAAGHVGPMGAAAILAMGALAAF